MVLSPPSLTQYPYGMGSERGYHDGRRRSEA
jgi:hypothetical protein